MTRDELETIGREWLRLVELVKKEGIVDEHHHVRFRDSDLSVKGAALLSFSGLMIAADTIFLSASPSSVIAPHQTCGGVGFTALLLFIGGAICAMLSLLVSRTGVYQSAWSSFGLMKLYNDRRQKWLLASAALTCVGTLMYLASIFGTVTFGRCA